MDMLFIQQIDVFGCAVFPLQQLDMILLYDSSLFGNAIGLVGNFGF